MTEQGKNSAYIRAREFKNKYEGIIPDDDDLSFESSRIPSLVKTFSSPKRRSSVSLFMRLKGLFPNSEIFKGINLDSFNVTEFMQKTFKTEYPDDYMFNILENQMCQKIIEEKFNKSRDFKAIELNAKKMFTIFHENFTHFYDSLPQDMHIYIKIFYIVDYLERFMEAKSELNEEEQKLKELFNRYYNLILETTAFEPSLTRLFTSIIYSEIIKNFEYKLKNNDETTLLLFSAHDITISAFIHSLNANYESLNYNFNDELNFILYELDEEYYISIKFNNQELELNFCENKKICEYEKFKEFVNEYIFSKDDLIKFCMGDINILSKKEEIKSQEKSDF